MAVSETELKQFTFVQGATTVIKKYTSPTAFTTILQKGSTVLNLTQTEFGDMVAVIDAAEAQKYEPEYGPTGSSV